MHHRPRQRRRGPLYGTSEGSLHPMYGVVNGTNWFGLLRCLRDERAAMPIKREKSVVQQVHATFVRG